MTYNPHDLILTFKISIYPRFENDEWYLDVTEGFEGQTSTHQRIGPVPFEMLSQLATEIREMHAKTIHLAIEAFRNNQVSDEQHRQNVEMAKKWFDARNIEPKKPQEYDSIYPAAFIDWGRFKR